jgi:hypothetical protein
MKLSVEMIADFERAAARLDAFVNAQLKQCTTPKEREALLPYVGAAQTTMRMAHILMKTEVTVKGV